MNRTVAVGFRGILAAGISLFFTACGGTTPSNSALNLAGTWTVTTVSTQGHKGFSGTAALSQSGQGLGVNGATTLAAAIGQITVSQNGTALTGTITNSMQKVGYSFVGTLSSGNLTISGSTSCGTGSNTTQSTSMTGTISSSSAAGTYTITRGSGCYYSNDAGTFVATKQ
jgi:hypothetical protein